MRWVLDRDRENVVIRLVDDTGGKDSDLDVRFFGMEAPLVGRRCMSDGILGGRSVDPPGGLFLARQGKFEDCVFVSSSFSGRGFEVLNVDSSFSNLQNKNELRSEDLALYSKWHNARRYGPIVQVR